ncbi:MAG TPA: TonB-dependent receptor [Bryobacteraceae bacterium]|nr:TonB-dependent receptor [Bryobacteraceae bacterium]
MRLRCLFISLIVCAAALFAQVGNGIITGTVIDPAGAVVAGAAVEARNSQTGVVYSGVTTNAGVYTISDLPIGTYTVTVKVQGFKTYTHANLAVGAAQILREDAKLEVGASAESVTVTAEASLLKTETGELSHNVTLEQMQDLPLLGIGTVNSGTSGFRNPYSTLQILPGVSQYNSSGQFTLNGLGGNMTETMRIEGQDATSRLFGTYDYTQIAQPSADSIQEMAYQTSNYAPEYGQAGSVVINMTMKSGTNQYHGTGYDYFVNEDLNAGYPFTVSGGPGSTTGGSGGKFRPRNRRNDFGGTLGGPVYIPKVYDGHNKTFFFFNYEEFLESTLYGNTDTVPTTAYRNGDFSAISPNGNCSLCAQYGVPTGALGGTTDALGRPMFANEIYDPNTRGIASNGLGYANPFPNNQIPVSRFDPVTLNIEKLIPSATNSNLTSNYFPTIPGGRYSAIPSIKIDENISNKDKISFYWSRDNTESQISQPLGGADGLPLEIGAYRGTFVATWTTRLNYDRTITPTLLLHLGAGYYHTTFLDHAPFLNFDPASVGLTGFVIHRQFPSITGNLAAAGTPAAALGGMQNMGEAIQTLNYEEKPSYVANLTWIRGKHTYKVGAELYFENTYNGNFSTVTLTSGANATAQPLNYLAYNFNGFTQGFGYASWLLGDYSSTTQTPQENYRQGQQVWGLYAQDSWKVTRKFTLDYGLRWDYSTPFREQYGRLGQFSETLPNANAGGHPGATIYASTCNCQFYQPTYPYAVGPRLGAAYQLDSKTVLRAGWGVNYQFAGGTGAGGAAGSIVAANGAYPLSGNNPFVNIETPGAIVAPSWPVTDPNRYPVLGTVGVPGVSDPTMPDANQNRPSRIEQWSVGIQREITHNFIMEASYVANRGVWEQGSAYAASGPLGFLSQISPAMFAKYNLYPYPGTGPAGYNYKPAGNAPCVPGNDCDRYLLTQPLTSAAVIQKVGNILPYTGFAGTTLLSALYPFPQFGAIGPTGSATGNSKYDSLQIKATKRFSHGLQAGGAYTFAKGFSRPTRQDFFNPATNPWAMQQIPPQTLTFNATYTVPKAAFLPKYVNAISHDWQIGFFANYQSGIFLTPPSSPTANYLTSEDIRNPGVPLYLKDINNIHSYNPYYDIVLNPAAWTSCPTNSTCPAASTLYSDFRAPRHPQENANIGRHFRVGKEGKYDFYVRGEFVNVFNRTQMPNPITTNPQNQPSKINQSIYTAGFGVIPAYLGPNTGPLTNVSGFNTQYLTGRTGTLIARFSF